MLRTSLAFIGRRGATAFVISLCRRKIRFHWCGKTIAYCDLAGVCRIGKKAKTRRSGFFCA
jgi:hypothetical protein